MLDFLERSLTIAQYRLSVMRHNCSQEQIAEAERAVGVLFSRVVAARNGVCSIPIYGSLSQHLQNGKKGEPHQGKTVIKALKDEQAIDKVSDDALNELAGQIADELIGEAVVKFFNVKAKIIG